jgi:hypothetical protein
MGESVYPKDAAKKWRESYGSIPCTCTHQMRYHYYLVERNRSYCNFCDCDTRMIGNKP